jgi:hypothetical protein
MTQGWLLSHFGQSLAAFSGNPPHMGASNGGNWDHDGLNTEPRWAMLHTTQVLTTSCLGRTCLKWQPDGELSALDLQLVLERLSQVDEDVVSILDRTVDEIPCPSIS